MTPVILRLHCDCPIVSKSIDQGAYATQSIEAITHSALSLPLPVRIIGLHGDAEQGASA